MPSSLTANIGAGIAQGAAAGFAEHRAQPERAARHREATARADLSEQQLADYQAAAPVRTAQQESDLATLQAQTYQTNANLAKQQSYDAFGMYDVDGDARHLNNWLTASKSNPVAASTTNGMTRLDNVVRTPETEKMLRAQGITDLDGFFSDPGLVKSFSLGTMPSGSQQLVDMNRMYAVTGYAQHTTNEQQKQLAMNSQLMLQMRQGANLTELKKNDAVVTELADVMNLPRDEVYRMLREEPDARTGRGATSMIERVAAELRQSNPDLAYRDSLTQAAELTRTGRVAKPTNEAAFISQYQEQNPDASYEDALTAYREAGRDERTSGQKNIEFSEEAKTMLDDEFGGDFLDADLSNLTNKQQANMAQYVNRIEKVGGLELSAEEKKSARAIRKLMTVARTTGEQLTSEQTGPIDSVLRSFKSYLSDNVDGKAATVSYEAFRAIARNALFGSQVSNADYKAFNAAVASLQQQTGPVLVSLKTQLELLRDDMQAMGDLNDPYVAKARFGVGIDELDSITDALDERISIINSIANGRPVEGITVPAAKEGSGIKVTTTPEGSKPSAERKSLDDIFGGQ